MADLPTIDLLQSLLRYDPNSGRLFWRFRSESFFARPQQAVAWNKRCAGQAADHRTMRLGYRQVLIYGRRFYAHRVAWAIHHGEWPSGEVDHVSGDRADNRITNLRVVSKVDNMRNAGLRRDNSSGPVGVSLDRRRGQWRATITVSGRQKWLGYHDTPEAAAAARSEAAARLGFHENHGGKRVRFARRAWEEARRDG